MLVEPGDDFLPRRGSGGGIRIVNLAPSAGNLRLRGTGAIGMAGREKLDNLIFVINCNLQRLDGPVRGNGKVIQELEGLFRGAGWRVIKVVWGREWDDLLARDTDGVLVEKMNATVDGSRPAARAPSPTRGSSTCSRYVRLWNGWTWTPSATSPAVPYM